MIDKLTNLLVKPLNTLIEEQALLYARTEKLAELIDSGHINTPLEVVEGLANNIAFYNSAISIAAATEKLETDTAH